MKYKLSTEKEGELEEEIIETDSYKEAWEIYKYWMFRIYEGALDKEELETWGTIQEIN